MLATWQRVIGSDRSSYFTKRKGGPRVINVSTFSVNTSPYVIFHYKSFHFAGLERDNVNCYNNLLSRTGNGIISAISICVFKNSGSYYEHSFITLLSN